MVVNADASSSRAGTLGPSGTFVTAGGEAGVQGGSDYQAAVQAASQGADGSVIWLTQVLYVDCVPSIKVLTRHARVCLLYIISSQQMAGQDS